MARIIGVTKMLAATARGMGAARLGHRGDCRCCGHASDEFIKYFLFLLFLWKFLVFHIIFKIEFII
nr:hypothetical protein [uncultured Albidiferax sp.]